MKTYLVAENGGNASVGADRTAAGDWERFRFVDPNGGQLESGDSVNILTSGGNYLKPVRNSSRSDVMNLAVPFKAPLNAKVRRVSQATLEQTLSSSVVADATHTFIQNFPCLKSTAKLK